MANAEKLKRLIANCKLRLEWEGAQSTPDNNFNDAYILPTSCGNLSIKISPPDDATLKRHCREYGEPTITLFCKFDNPAAIKAFNLQGNNITGKWNWHFLTQAGVDAFIHNLQLIIDNPVEVAA